VEIETSNVVGRLTVASTSR